MKNEKAIIFDFGGTLDTNGVHWSVKFFDSFNKRNLASDIESFNRTFVKSDEYLAGKYNEITSYKVLLERQISYIADNIILNNNINRNYLVDDILCEIWLDVMSCIIKSKYLLLMLKDNFALSLVSNFYGNLNHICDDLNISKYFETIIDSKIVNMNKPHPGIFSLALKKLNVLPENVFVVGDSYERDIVPSKIVGCKTIWLKNKSFKEYDNVESADFIISDIEQVLEISGRSL